ncbi:CPBP family intramembrane glutamic endopeptidase [Tautonia marina]|uniref:CPBP family intramembrane glutamic endopeptidase n=1 Tax=Tautonia marina TaxID=2653855 RepID=UPI00126088A1|nr:CPBP family intramembrane glutamic endopeptidase [Tautonia marina]
MRAYHEPGPGSVAKAPPSRVFARPEGGGEGRRVGRSGGYWSQCRGASAAIMMVLPLLAIYEGGIAALGGDEALRAGVDAWIGRLTPDRFRVPDWAPSVVLALGLIAWRIAEPGRFRMRWLVVAIVECAVLGAGLLALFRWFDHWFEAAGGSLPLEVASPVELDLNAGELIGLVGAGIFEEAVFRLGLLGLCYAVLRVLLIPNVLATAMAVSGSALLFSMAHHVGEVPGAFSWSTFVFRWLAGVYFAWVMILRGFGIAVGTHLAYDLLVVADPWAG